MLLLLLPVNISPKHLHSSGALDPVNKSRAVREGICKIHRQQHDSPISQLFNGEAGGGGTIERHLSNVFVMLVFLFLLLTFFLLHLSSHEDLSRATLVAFFSTLGFRTLFLIPWKIEIPYFWTAYPSSHSVVVID